MSKTVSRIFPVPTYMFKDNTLYKVYKALLESADVYGRIYASNEEIAEMVGKTTKSSTVTTSINKLKSMGVVTRIRKTSRAEKIGLKRILQLCPPYDKLSAAFQKQGSIPATEFLKEMRNL
jgi:DNA-binding Lrp family transcriptional regulator